ncbi:MAG: hypothetical protein IMW89_11355 [Ktedonobacteraceae bacterium]|nr:hypothetical protein [Ktedonobacteraceae bacterium]
MSGSFAELYGELSKDVFMEQAHRQLEMGSDAAAYADAYAERGKPDFVLAYLLLADVADDVKRDIFARAYERRALLSEQKAEEFDRRFHRPFPMIKLAAQKDRVTAQRVRRGERIQEILAP